jgi:Na+-translocating ferredoxin:NAD+ oxidoreductase RNF subunit RnfB
LSSYRDAINATTDGFKKALSEAVVGNCETALARLTYGLQEFARAQAHKHSWEWSRDKGESIADTMDELETASLKTADLEDSAFRTFSDACLRKK